MWPANREHPHRGEREQGSAACGSVQGGALRSGGGARRRLRTSGIAGSRRLPGPNAHPNPNPNPNSNFNLNLNRNPNPNPNPITLTLTLTPEP
eukprot:scaffold5376_cov48-Phaeocystis_antarctica.AAC.2